MDQFQSLINHITSKVALSDAEIQAFVSCFKVTRVKKRQFIIQPDFVAKYRNYIVEGAFRAYVVADAGEEHTVQFAIEDWWISDYSSYINQQPASMFVIALEDSILLQIDFEREQKLKASNHKFETFFRITAERTVSAMQKRLISNLTKTAEQRFHEFEQNYPKIVHRVPQYTLASFLGMTTQYMSKLRNTRLHKKS